MQSGGGGGGGSNVSLTVNQLSFFIYVGVWRKVRHHPVLVCGK